MKKTRLSKNVKLFIAIIVAVSIGSFFTDILYQIDVNVWIARGTGCCICVIIGLLFNCLWLADDKNK